jgi:hypothetical protein
MEAAVVVGRSEICFRLGDRVRSHEAFFAFECDLLDVHNLSFVCTDHDDLRRVSADEIGGHGIRRRAVSQWASPAHHVNGQPAYEGRNLPELEAEAEVSGMTAHGNPEISRVAWACPKIFGTRSIKGFGLKERHGYLPIAKILEKLDVSVRLQSGEGGESSIASVLPSRSNLSLCVAEDFTERLIFP